MIATRRTFLGIALLIPAAASAQKRTLTQADWDRWKSITGSSLSNDGKWAAYTLAPLVGDGELIVRSTGGSTEYRVARGYLGRPNNVPGGLRPRAGANPEEEPSGPNIAPAQLTADSRFAVVLTYPPQAEFERAGRDRRRATALQNRSDLAILSLADGRVSTVARVRSFRLPRSSGSWIAYVVSDSTASDSARGTGARPGGQAGAPSARRRFGSNLVLRNMATGKEERLADVLDYAFDDSARVFVYTVVSRSEGKDGAFARNLANGMTASLLSGTGDYDQVAIDRAASQVAFVSNRDNFSKEPGGSSEFSLYYSSLKEGIARPVVSPASLNGVHVSGLANVAFTRSGSAVIFGIAPITPDTLSADSLSGKSVFDLWHYKDQVLQPTQRLNAARDRNRAFAAIYQIAAKKLVRLANDSIPVVSVSDDGRLGLANSRERYMIEQMWGEGATDVYLIDATTGAARLVREKISGNAQFSPDARFVTFYDAGRWFVYAVATGRTIEVLPPNKGISWARETWDTPSIPQSWGIAGWTRGDRSLLLYDRWDIWDVDPTGARPAVSVTDSLGRKNNIVLRLAIGGAGGAGGAGGGGGGGGGGFAANMRGDDERALDPSKPLLLRAVDEETKASGFYRDQIGVTRPPERIVMADAAFGSLIKANDAEQYLLTRGTFVDFPNLYTGPSLTSLTKISDGNPQQRDYNWGTVELVRWTSSDGVPLKGLLFKPENFDPSKKYPMVTYFYESLSQNLHNYVPPNGRNVINPIHYASNGYLVFEPDIHYEEGYPGPSAMKSIVPGVQALLARGYVDPKALGIQGQSWGGYQALYIITQTHMFSAAMTGAPVVNMTSAYGGIRWGSGIARSGQYENGQSRIAGSIWQYPTRFIENSPLFWLDKITTPLFVMSNDMDDAVPWYQGIELFVAMRRLGKEVYLIDYNNDVHNPQSRANQKDIAFRMQQFFDAKLRGMPEPDWMKKGIPYLSKGRDQIPAGAAPVMAGTQIPNP
ncbi:MAG TPA: prolyl oligopeptidase family serine peptidase [Gemmatimonadaceae bacterium]|nr:prolyl oligopeptidase family serine peptidase [Gemmatimonadaceae bacterium]